ncbi:MAG TPA: 3-phosphoserine/phosphohydroxythreonine transaminase [Polyangia bacterium]|jgi:phosphoserine aminotransferase|nr:3-phosphoserine/phosphohydroxythreonine transaminase [Polyangia bacterium]
MSNRVFNFSAGPAMLPIEVLEASAKGLVDFQGKGFGIAEVSHRSKEFDGVIDEAIAKCRSLLDIPDSHDVLFLQGGATQLFNTIPMNFLNGPADYVVSGEWSKKAASAAQAAYGDKIRVIASSEGTKFDRPPTGWSADPAASYLHVCSNETVHGHRLVEWPDHPTLIVDSSSEMMSRPHPIARCALVYAGAQKNLGPAGVVLTIVRKDMYARIAKSVPKIFSFQALAEAKSCLNTPPTFGVYFLLETFRWMESQGGLAAIEKRNAEKAALIYDAIDSSGGYYKGTVADKAARSHMNVTFVLPSEEITEKFVKDASKAGMVALKGYRTVGGIRASMYNAMPVAGARALADFMKSFAKAG